MQAGRELDKLIAERVMGFGTDYKMPKDFPHLAEITAYSIDIEWAFEVFNKFTSRYLWYDDATDTWHCHLDPKRCVMRDCRYHEKADKAPLAICLAALKAVERDTVSDTTQCHGTQQ